LQQHWSAAFIPKGARRFGVESTNCDFLGVARNSCDRTALFRPESYKLVSYSNSGRRRLSANEQRATGDSLGSHLRFKQLRGNF